MNSTVIARTLSGLALIAAALVAASPAEAATVIRYAAPGGNATPAQCIAAGGPFCSFKDAVNGTGVDADDEAVILPGDYSDTAGDLDNGQTLTAGRVYGQAGQPRPVLISSGSFGGITVTNSELAHLEIRYTGNSQSNAMYAVGPNTVVDDSIITAGGSDHAVACFIGAGATLRNSVCTNEGAFAAAVSGGTSGGSGGTYAALVNVTAINTAVGGDAISFHFSDSVNPGDAWTINITNTIARPGTNGNGIAGRSTATGTNCPFVDIVVESSNFGNAEASGAAPCSAGDVLITPTNTSDNQNAATSPPLLAADGFHQLANSPTIDAGSPTLAAGTDIDGEARTIGTAPDIGADEFAPAAPPPPGGPPAGPNPPSSDAQCGGLTPTIVGEPGGTVIVGTDGNDVIVAGDGDDIVIAGRGNDVLCGGAGDDVLKGKSGNDRIIGEAGDDRLRGGRGSDFCRGGAGTDSFRKCER